MRCLLMFVAAAVVTNGFAWGAQPQQPNEHLKAFAPFIGMWRYEGPVLEEGPMAEKGSKSVAQMSWRWILDKQVLMTDWTVELQGGVKVSGKGLVGWNAAEEKVMGGNMDSMGGIGLGTHVIEGETITSASESVDAQGRKIVMKVVVKKTDKDTLTWQAVERTGGDSEGPSPIYTFKRVKRTKGKETAK